MTKAAKTVYFFSFYLIPTGLILTFVPNLLLTLFGFEPTTEVWVRVLGTLVTGIGTIYYFVAPTDNTTFLRVTVWGRAAIMGWFTLFVLVGWAKPQLLIFGVVDLMGALWTWTSLKKA